MKRKLRKVILIIAVIAFAASAGQLINILLSYRKGTNEYGNLEKYVITEEITREVDESDEDPDKGTPVISIDANKLKSINPDYKGWIYVKGTMVNYPIVQTNNNDYYMNHTFNGTVNSAGGIFLECLLEDGLESQNAIIYGHNMLNGSMFGTLKRYRDIEFFNEHPTFILFVEDKPYTYEIFATYTVRGDISDAYTYFFGSDKNFLEYIDKMKTYADYDTGVTVNAKDKIVTLSTCTNRGSDRYIVQAKRVE